MRNDTATIKAELRQKQQALRALAGLIGCKYEELGNLLKGGPLATEDPHCLRLAEQLIRLEGVQAQLAHQIGRNQALLTAPQIPPHFPLSEEDPHQRVRCKMSAFTRA